MKPASDVYETPVLVMPEKRQHSDSLVAEPISTATILETYSVFLVELVIPDSAAGNCKIKIEDGMLNISAKGIAELELNLAYIAKTTFHHGLFYRLFLSLGWYGDEGIQVTCNNRVLTIHIPKKNLLEDFVSEVEIN